MKNLLLGSLLLLSTWGGLTRIHNRNEAVRAGTAAYARREYGTAAAAYKRAVVDLGSREEAVWLNLAHATMRAGKNAEARQYYSRLVISKEAAIRSVALQQLAALAAGQGDYAQAIGFLRQALVANARNPEARYNYEVLRNFLGRRATAPPSPPPGTDGGPNATEPNNSQSRPGTEGPGEIADPNQAPDPRTTPQNRPDAAGRPTANQPSANPGNSAAGSLRPGSGQQQNIAQGTEPGSVRGLSNAETGPEAPAGSSSRGGTEAASNAEANIQTQRARLQQLNLSPGQARQILEALHAAERQYLQQLPRKATQPQSKTKPGW